MASASEILDNVFRQMQIVGAEDPGQYRDHFTRLMPEQVIDKVV
jgi:hypothetical protein